MFGDRLKIVADVLYSEQAVGEHVALGRLQLLHARRGIRDLIHADRGPPLLLMQNDCFFGILHQNVFGDGLLRYDLEYAVVQILVCDAVVIQDYDVRIRGPDLTDH